MTELRELEVTIIERKRYLRAQEVLIFEVTEAGNGELMALSHEIALARKELRELKTDIRTAAQDKVMLMEDIRSLQGQASILVVL